MEDMDGKDLVIFLLTLFIPPLGVGLKVGLKTHFWINLALTLFGFYIAGIVHGLYIVMTTKN